MLRDLLEIAEDLISLALTLTATTALVVFIAVVLR